jgi:hypothetical protein
MALQGIARAEIEACSMFILIPKRRDPGDKQPPRRIGLLTILFLIFTILGLGIAFNWATIFGWLTELSGGQSSL